ncbi:hypothetical protein MHLP_02420 [Candidatus Mycoplasma haematolamae str. Purdue]|uniref:Uncharacterized protein n=1 Tax=Mycoplasma haematolamae (strain Purdue) TaxID=1212765 RepID=I7CJM8_MYCHA|nr:hypothetical protein [Candidatus Mycoplasma haematolamae]AFO52064.1 hypothetical protein MHLP_02420 [Candidatus Mycoplasma haematolamae str. Purdue]
MKTKSKTTKSSPLFLEPEKLRQILRKGSEALLLEADEEVIEKAAKLIESMKPDLLKVFQAPLSGVETFRSHETLTLEEIDEFYRKIEEAKAKLQGEDISKKQN